jgi:putative alpha-1,2-mannosidase
MGNFPIWPLPGCQNDDIDLCSFRERNQNYDPNSLKASAGYFALKLLDGNITSEMTAANRTALYRFTFPPIDKSVNVTLGVTTGPATGPVFGIALHDLPVTRKDAAAVVDAKTGRIYGNGTFVPSFGIGDYKSYFCMDFTGGRIRDAGVYKNNRAKVAPAVRVVPDGVNTNGALPAGAWIRFWPNGYKAANSTTNSTANHTEIKVRVGVSLVSEEQACRNAEKEVPDFDFEKVLNTNIAAWREKLKPVSVDNFGVSQDLQKTFWSGIYRIFISPQDYTGENPLWKSSEPYYDSYYCIWDSYRSMHQLLTLIDPHSQTEMMRSLLDIYRHEGWLPDCRMSLCKGFTQGGSNADTLLVDSWMKGVEGLDWKLAYRAMVKDAEVESTNWSVEGRGGLESWKTLGYIPKDDFDPLGSGPITRSVSRTVEYAYNDYCIAQMALDHGHISDYKKYMARSNNWENLWNGNQTSLVRGTDTGIVGFLQPRHENGTFDYQDPVVCSHENNFDGCYLNPTGMETYEGSPWLYTLYVPGDMASLITTLGGPQEFVRRLNFYHESQISYIGDEQAFLPVFLYHYAGRPGLSSARAHFYIPGKFKATPTGLPGNDDSGAMGSFAALAMMGIFPNPGQNVYFITPPFFPELNITSPITGKTATIRNKNFDPAYRNIYIQSATLNGRNFTRSWITHDFFLRGGVLELTLGPTEGSWGSRNEDLPPSLSTTGTQERTVLSNVRGGKEVDWERWFKLTGKFDPKAP